MNSTIITQAPKDKKARHAWRLEQQYLHNHHPKIGRNMMLVCNGTHDDNGEPQGMYHIGRYERKNSSEVVYLEVDKSSNQFQYNHNGFKK